ncbi:signal transduction histidine kinase [Arcanobacterium pluranimalium]|uniref:sensor histidine kinase n=1 Tax=Arcanobacterium pluranimalium TaxID=108028 RepID=UPI00195E6D55|nr:HAMP domain-containing sensor histidine kinase [Arcanobacterium pluranimalium]MBM7824867.1 signal transduction histidine kinase [Arcanobacterium pluranimalium]
MRRRAIQMTSAAVAVAVLFLGIPAILFGVSTIWQSAEKAVASRAETVRSVIERRENEHVVISRGLLESFAQMSDPDDAHITYRKSDGTVLKSGNALPISPDTITKIEETRSGSIITVSVEKGPIYVRTVLLIIGAVALIMAAFVIGVLMAMRQSRKLSAPLIYMAASAEQIGAGQVRPQIKPSGIEEIDLVYQELERTADRIAGRIAAERQFAANAAHQLRTPLTALSMRVEEIQYLTDDPEIKEEAEKALEQIGRLGGVVDELMANASSDHGRNFEAIALHDVFEQQGDEWEKPFRKAKRTLAFDVGEDAVVLATPGSVSQILATLIENSLKYGAGTTTVTATKNGRVVQIKVCDAGEGISDELVPHIFLKGVSAGGSTGIGLAVAKDLAKINDGRLELTAQKPAEFTLTLRTVPESLGPDRLLPQGAIHAVGARRRRR